MKRVIVYLLFCVIAISISIQTYTQVPYCLNIGFELGDFTNWVGSSWKYSIEFPENSSDPVEGFINRRHTIITDQEAYDPNTGYQLKMIPPGYSYSARLGDGRRPGDSSPRNWHQTLSYTMNVDSLNALLIINFALVLQWDSGHEPEEEPRFSLTLYDSTGDTIPDCANYNVFATNSTIEGFQLIHPPGEPDPVQWRDWTAVGVDLTKYIGQTITIEFLAADCILGFDFGYAYFVVECQPLNIGVRNCGNDTIARLTAPAGFKEYKWIDSSETVVDTNQIFELVNPPEGVAYTCKLTSETGCHVTLNTTVYHYNPEAKFGSYMIDCINNEVQLVDSSTTNNGYLLYRWLFDDGGTSSEASPLYKFSTSGLHDIKLVVINPPSVCTDTLEKTVESFSPPLIDIDGDSTYCPGESIWLKAYGAYRYEWSNGSTGDSIEVGTPDTVMLIGYSSTGCADTNYKVIIEEPDWELLISGDTVICFGDSTYLTASGAIEYYWNTGDSLNTIRVDSTGIFIVYGANQRGCIKKDTINVLEVHLPDAGFTLSDYTVSNRDNEITGTILPQDNVAYLWEMGDGLTERGASINHAYTITNEKLFYEVYLVATNQYGCTKSSSDVIDVIPFVPNVFSPNGDGINDRFMPHLNLQVFDRHGVVMYKGTEGWDGRYKGQPVGPDTFFYLITYVNREQQEKIKKGYLTLIR